MIRLGLRDFGKILAKTGLIFVLSFYWGDSHSWATPLNQCSTLTEGEFSKNPLLSDKTKIRWTEITPEHILPALKKQFQTFKEQFKTILESEASPTFENTVLAVDFASEELERTLSVYSILDHNHNTEALRSIQKEVNDLISELNDLIYTNLRLSNRVSQVLQNQTPGTEEFEIARDFHESFLERGIHLGKTEQEELKLTYKRISELGDQFDHNRMIQRNSIRIKIKNLSELEGIPPESIEKVRATQDEKGDYWVSLNRPALVTQIMEKALSSDLRKRFYFSNSVKEIAQKYITQEEAGLAWTVDNRSVLLEIVNLRQKIANLTGRSRYADRVLPNRMAKSVERVENFYRDLLPGVQVLAQREKAELLKYAQSISPALTEVAPWDQSYFVTKLYEQKFRLDDEKIAEYFEADRTLKSVLDFYSTLFDIHFIKDTRAQSYLPDVEVYRITDAKTGTQLSELHFDLYTRETKAQGAWKASIQKAGLTPRGHEASIMEITLNLERAPPGKPTLLKIDEVNTLFHELGHAMHEALTTVKYRNLAGTSVTRDFVEFPSQIMENWLYTPEFLNTGAVHYKTGKSIPKEWIKRIREAGNFRAGTALRRQMILGLIDLNWHTLTDGVPASIPEYVDLFEKSVYLNHDLPYIAEFSPISPGFSHIFSGGYAMGYYSYLWGNMIEADGFEYWYSDRSKIKEKALSLRNLILSRGGSVDPNELYRAWTGRDFSPKAFLKRSGL
jgi:peptidyl-dipeptidase Dcp